MTNTIKLEELTSAEIRKLDSSVAKDIAPMKSKTFESLTTEQRLAIVNYFSILRENNLYAFREFLGEYKSRKFENLPEFVKSYFLALTRQTSDEALNTGDAFIALWFFDNMQKKGDLPEQITKYFDRQLDLASRTFHLNPIRAIRVLSMIEAVPFDELPAEKQEFVCKLFDYDNNQLPYQTVAAMADYVQAQLKERSFSEMPELLQNFVKDLYLACVARQQTREMRSDLQRLFGDNYSAWAAFNTGFAGVPDQYDPSELYSPCDQLVFRNLRLYADAEDAFIIEARKRNWFDIFMLSKKIAELLEVGDITTKKGYVYHYDEREVFPCNKVLTFHSCRQQTEISDAETKVGETITKDNLRNYTTLTNKLTPVFEDMVNFIAENADEEIISDFAIVFFGEGNLTHNAILMIKKCNSREDLVDCLNNLYTNEKKSRGSRKKDQTEELNPEYDFENPMSWTEDNLRKRISQIQFDLAYRKLTPEKRQSLEQELGHLMCETEERMY